MSADLEGFEEFEAVLAGLMGRLAPAPRKKLSRHIARTLRKVNAARIRAQTDPDGKPFAERQPDTYRPSFRHDLKTRRRLIRQKVRRKFFARLRNRSHLRANWTPDEASAGFNNPTVARIAAVHHYGLRDRVYRNGSLQADYPERQLLGMTGADRGEVLDSVLKHLETF